MAEPVKFDAFELHREAWRARVAAIATDKHVADESDVHRLALDLLTHYRWMDRIEQVARESGARK